VEAKVDPVQKVGRHRIVAHDGCGKEQADLKGQKGRKEESVSALSLSRWDSALSFRQCLRCLIYGCRVDPFSKKDWYDVKAPSSFSSRNVGKTLVTRTQGTKVHSLVSLYSNFVCKFRNFTTSGCW
jgi:hypothetical protein